MLTALIMAGGKGTRFWPLSTEEKPKQFLNLIGEESMLQMTVNRIKPIIPLDRIFICTGKQYVDLVKEQLPEMSSRNIIIEPEGRNTAPCIALSAFIINRYFKDSTMVVLPSDHLIKDEDEFRNIVLKSEDFVEHNNEAIITLGMEATRAETGYGYIKYSSEENKFENIIKVEQFVEKPNLKKAKEYLKAGSYLWNGGMFLWNTHNVLEQIRQYSKETYYSLNNISEVKEEALQNFIDENYKNTEAISIDYAVLEKSEDIYVIPCSFGWDDVGSWEALDRYRKKDEAGNVLVGKSRAIKGSNNLVISANNKVIVEGLDDIYVIENDGNILVGNKAHVKNVKNLKELV